MKKLVVLVAIFFVSMITTLDAQRTSESRREHRENRTERSNSKAENQRGNKCGKKHKIKHKNHNRKMHKKAGFEGRAPRGDRKMKGNKERGVY